MCSSNGSESRVKKKANLKVEAEGVNKAKKATHALNASIPAYLSHTTNSYSLSGPFLDQLYSSVPGSEDAWDFIFEIQVWTTEGLREGLKET